MLAGHTVGTFMRATYTARKRIKKRFANRKVMNARWLTVPRV
jgi:hypothetical protein